MQFKDMLNRDHYKRINASKSTILLEPLNYYDNQIVVENGQVLTEPNRSKNLPGIIYVNGERIEFFVKDNNILSQIRRGTLGTGTPVVHVVGSDILDISITETIPYTDDLIVDTDEHPKPNTTLEILAKLGTPFKKVGGTVTAGNASGVNDGAAAMIIASKAAVEKYNLKPKAKIVMMAVAGVPPRIMGIGPLYSSKKILEKTGLSVNDMDVIELNEAFASQGLATLRGLGLADDEAKVNPNGGAIALGHPLGMSGARLVMTALNQLEQTNGRYGLCTMCIGVGQGISMIIENLNRK
jgi:hypothetical protein